MKILLLAFGFAADVIGKRKLEIELPEGATTADIRILIAEQYPALRNLMSYSIAVNHVYIKEDLILKPMDEVAIIPPVSGG